MGKATAVRDCFFPHPPPLISLWYVFVVVVYLTLPLEVLEAGASTGHDAHLHR